jgi:hypothetical protein
VNTIRIRLIGTRGEVALAVHRLRNAFGTVLDVSEPQRCREADQVRVYATVRL